MLKSEETNTRDSDKEDFLEEKACSLNRRRKQEKSLEKNLELVRRYLPLRVAERLTNLKRFYCGR